MNTTSFHIHLFRAVGVKVQNCSKKLLESLFIPRNVKTTLWISLINTATICWEACKSGLKIHPFLPGNVAYEHFVSVRNLQDSWPIFLLPTSHSPAELLLGRLQQGEVKLRTQQGDETPGCSSQLAKTDSKLRHNFSNCVLQDDIRCHETNNAFHNPVVKYIWGFLGNIL